MKLLVLSVVLFCTTILFSQKKDLSLSDAVLQQYRALSPEKLYGFNWLPNSKKYVYTDNKFTTIFISEVGTYNPVKLIDVKEISQLLNDEIRYFGGLKWISQDQFIFNNGNKYFQFNFAKKTGKLIYEFDEKSENIIYNAENQLFAFTKENNLYYLKDTVEVAVTSFTDKNIVSGQFIARNEFGIHDGIFWSNKGNKIAFYQKDQTDVADYPLLDIESIPGSLNSIKYPMTGQSSEKPRVGIYDLESKKTVYISPRHKLDDYLTNVTWTPDDKFFIVVEINREQNHLWVNVYNAETGEFVRSLFDEKNEKWVEPENPVFFPSQSSNNFIWISQRDGFNNLYFYDWSDKLKLQLTQNKFVLKNIVGTINNGNEVVFTATGESPLDFKYYAVSLKGKQRVITSIPGTHSLSIGLDGKYFFDEYSSHSVPSISQILDANGKVLKELVKGQNKLTDYAIGETEIGQIKANDGTVLYTRLIKPSNFDPSKKYPVMVYVYGGPHAQMIQNEWLDGSNLWMHWMAEKGYLVFTVDNRGSANRGFEFESVIHRQLGTIEMEDQLSGVKYLKSLKFVDTNRLAIHGWSFGGFMTTSLMLRNPGVFKVGVAGGPVTDWKFYEIMYGERYMDMPIENPKGYEEASLLNYVKNLKGDLLLIHGTADDVVVMQHNYALIKKFVEAGVQVDFFPYPMHKHNVMGRDRVHLMEKVLTYILENNK
jgi:dipeptidyl-peptidase-4